MIQHFLSDTSFFFWFYTYKQIIFLDRPNQLLVFCHETQLKRYTVILILITFEN